MRVDSAERITQLLQFWSNGSQAALEKLTSLVYGEFRPLTKGTMRGEREGHILQTTASNERRSCHVDHLEKCELAQAWLLRELSPAASGVKAKSE